MKWFSNTKKRDAQDKQEEEDFYRREGVAFDPEDPGIVMGPEDLMVTIGADGGVKGWAPSERVVREHERLAAKERTAETPASIAGPETQKRLASAEKMKEKLQEFLLKRRQTPDQPRLRQTHHL